MCGAVGSRGRRDAPSRDALRGILRDDAKRALDCAHARARVTAIHMRSRRRANCADRGLDRSHRFLCLATI